MAKQPASASEKYTVLKEMQEKFLAASEEYKAAKTAIEAKVAERDERVNNLNEEAKQVQASVDQLMALKAETETEMAESIKAYNEGVELIKTLSSNDLTTLIENKSPDGDVVAVMDGVLVLQSKETGWANANSLVSGKDFMYNISQFNHDDLQASQLEKAISCRANFDPSQVKSKDKAAGAFAFWVDGVCKVRKIAVQKVPQIEQLQESVKQASDAYEAKAKGIGEFQVQLKQEGEAVNKKATAILALKQEMEEISKIKFD